MVLSACDKLELFAFTRRLEFDAYRSDLEEMSLGPRDAAAMVRIEMAQHDYQVHRDKYERLRSDVTIKLKFLEENKVYTFLFLSRMLLLILSNIKMSVNVSFSGTSLLFLPPR